MKKGSHEAALSSGVFLFYARPRIRVRTIVFLSKQFFDDLAAVGDLHRTIVSAGEGGIQ